MEDSGVEPCVQDAEVEGFRRNLASNEARDEFYEPITHPFPPDPETDALKSEHKLTSDVPSKVSQLGDTESSDVRVAEPKRSISQEILDRAHRIAREITSETATSDNSSADMDVIRDASTKSIFNNLISSPSSASSRVGRGETENSEGILPEVVEVPEDQESSLSDEVIYESPKRHVDQQRPRYYSSRATTLPAKLQCQIFDPNTHPKMTRWEIFKRKFYLGAAHAIPTRASEGTADMDTPRASTAGPIDTESFCEVTNIEGLDLEGIPPMTQRSRKLLSWTRLKTGLHFKRKAGKGKSEEGPTGDPKGEPDTMKTMGEEDEEEEEAYSQAASHGEEDEEGATATTTTVPVTLKAKVGKDKSHNWFEALSQRLFAARRHRAAEDAPTPARPATAHTQQYYEIESNW